MNVLSLFDGISCGQVALQRAGIEYTNYYASEIDPYAIKVTQKNHPNTIQLGDITQINLALLPKIDLLIGGSPCQGFSSAGKQLNFNDPRSSLFFSFVDIKEKLNPKYFLLENVVMKKEWQDIISDFMGVQPILINSSLVSGQNRRRLYWTNIPNVTQPQDKNILLKDIIEDGFVDKDKSYCIDANYFRGSNLKRYFTRGSRQIVFKDKSQTLLATLYKENAKSMIKRNKMGLLVAKEDADFYEEYKHKIYFRKLKPIECERLQTLPDGYTECVSDTQRYKSIGNAWTVDVVSHIFSHIPLHCTIKLC